MIKGLLKVIVFGMTVFSNANAQDNLTLRERAIGFPDRVYQAVSKKMDRVQSRMHEKTIKTLRQLAREEDKLKRKLFATDSTIAASLFSDNQIDTNIISESGRNYLPYYDSLKTSFKFLLSHNNGNQIQQINQVISHLNSLDQRLNKTQAIERLLSERKQLLNDCFRRLGMQEELKAFNTYVYYYRQQMKEYQLLLADPSRLEREIVKRLSSLSVFQDFFRKHSEIAALFQVPDGYGTPASLQSLQARSDVLQQINGRLANGGPNAEAFLQQNIQQAQQQLNQLKERISRLGNSESDIDMPGFKPNHQKTKPFLKRLEFGTNIQSTRANSFIPTTTDLGLSLGYKLNDRSIVGIGASYKMGWGKDIRQITITHEGVGLRSFMEWKLKNSFYVSGGFEQNYLQRFENLQQLYFKADYWQQSGLLGISKKYRIGKKWNGDVKILFDFLYRSHVPVSQPILFRLGYSR